MPRRKRVQDKRVLKPRASASRVLRPRDEIKEQLISQRTRYKVRNSSKKVETEQPIAHRTISKVAGASQVAAIVSHLLASSVLDPDTGKMLEFR